MITLLYRKRTDGFSIEQIFDGLYDALNQLHLDVRRLELPYLTQGPLSVIRNVWYMLRHHRGGVLHITGDVHYAALLCPFARTVITVHDCGLLQRRTGLRRLAFWLLWFRLPLSLAQRVTVISHKTERELHEVISIPRHKVTVVPNFVGPQFMFTPREFSAVQPRILHVGTRPNKNLLRVIEALQGMNVELVIVGELDAPQRRALESARLSHQNVVAASSEQMVELYRSADIVSFPSTYEGFGLPILEAQAVGRPVLTSDIEPLRDVGGEGGVWLVNPQSTQSIRDGFAMLIESPELRSSLIEHGLLNCRRYSRAAVAERYRSIYRSVAAESI
jgi:glycosyltransferase involved in cell wall biosynthesis